MHESNDHFKYTQCVNTYTYSLTKINSTYLLGSYLGVDFAHLGCFPKNSVIVNVFVWWGGGSTVTEYLEKS